MPQPIYFVAFTLRDVPNFLTEPQIAFHISTKDWYKSGEFSEDHFSLKLAFFWSSKWMRKLLFRFDEAPESFVELLKRYLPDEDYRLVSSRDPNDLFINTPISSANLQRDLERLVKLVLDDGIKLRGIGFERPFYFARHLELGTNFELRRTIGHHCMALIELLRRLLPDYFDEVNRTFYR